MSYRDPQQAIDNRYQNLAKGLSNFYTSLNQGVDKWVAGEKAKQAKSRKILEGEIGGLEKEYQKEYSKVKSQGDQFTSALGKEEGVAMSQQIEDALVSMGRDLKKQIHEAGGQNASAATIRSLKTTMTSQMNGLYNDIVNWEAARIEYQQAKHLLPNQVGKILPGYNDALIHMFDAAEDGKNNMMLSLDPETKHWRISLIGEGTNSDGSSKIDETVDVTDWSTKHTDKDYFKKIEDMGKNPYAAAKRVIKDLAPKFTDDKGVIDRVKLTEYITKGDGQSALLPYIDEEDKRGHWRLISGLDADSNWKEYDEDYSDKSFLNKVIDNAILELPKMNFSPISTDTNITTQNESVVVDGGEEVIVDTEENPTEDEFNIAWANAKIGEEVLGPDGKKYKKE